MWLLTIWLQGRPQPVGLQFKTEATAAAAYAATRPPQPVAGQESWVPNYPTRTEITDDYGRSYAFIPSLFADALLMEMPKALAGDQEIQLMGHVSNTALQQRAQAASSKSILPVAPFRQ